MDTLPEPNQHEAHQEHHAPEPQSYYYPDNHHQYLPQHHRIPRPWLSQPQVAAVHPRLDKAAAAAITALIQLEAGRGFDEPSHNLHSPVRSYQYKQKPNPAFQCKICNIGFQYPKLLEMHYNGKQHKEKWLYICTMKNIIIPSEQNFTSQSISETQQNCEKNKIIEGLTVEAGRDRNQAEVKEQNYTVSQSLSPAAPVVKPNQASWCEICSVNCTSLQVLKDHNNGKLHNKNRLKIQGLKNTIKKNRLKIQGLKNTIIPKPAVQSEQKLTLGSSSEVPQQPGSQQNCDKNKIIEGLTVEASRDRNQAEVKEQNYTVSQSESPAAPVVKPKPASWCEICSVDCRTLKILAYHNNGMLHKKNMLKIGRLKNRIVRKPVVQSEQKLTMGSSPEAPQQPGSQQNCDKNKIIEGLTVEAGRDRNQAEVKEQNYTVSQSESPAAPVVKPNQASWCEICSVDCHNLKSLVYHNNGKLHKRNMLKSEGLKNRIIPKPVVQSEQKLTMGSISEVPQQPGSQQNCKKDKLVEGLTVEAGGVRDQAEAKEQNYTVSQSESLAVEPSNLRMMNVKKDQTKVKPKQAVRCEICSVDCPNLKVLEGHTNGKLHKKNMLKMEELNNIIIAKPAVQSDTKPTAKFISEVPQQPESQQNCEKQKVIENLAVEDVGVRNQAEAYKQNYIVSQSESPAVGPSDLQLIKLKEDQISNKKGRNKRKIGDTQEEAKKRLKTCLVCDLCNVKSNNQVSMDEHFSSKKHIARLNKLGGRQALSGPTGIQVLNPPNPILQTILHPQDQQHTQSSFPPQEAYMPPQAPHQAPSASGINPQFQSIPQTHGSVGTLDAGCQSAVTMIPVAQQAQLATAQPGIV